MEKGFGREEWEISEVWMVLVWGVFGKYGLLGWVFIYVLVCVFFFSLNISFIVEEVDGKG